MRKYDIIVNMANMKKDLSQMRETEIAELLKENDSQAWEAVLGEVVRQEEMSAARNRRRADWGVSLEELIGELYEDMMVKRKLWNFRGGGSLVGWMRSYMRGYLNRKNPNATKFVSLEAGVENDDGSAGTGLDEKISKAASDGTGLYAYKTEDLEVLRNERLEIAGRCFADLWKENSVQAYVMLLKTRFQMSSLEITERLGLSSAANCDQLFSRAVKKMREARAKYE